MASSSYISEYIKHTFNSLNYKRKEKTVIEDKNVKLNIFYDSFYVKNKKALVIICMDNTINNICSYTVLDKRVNLYTIRIKNYDIKDIKKLLELIEKTHKKLLIIHCFKLSTYLLSEKDLFDNENYYHLSITPFFNDYNHDENVDFYFKLFVGNINTRVPKNINYKNKNTLYINISNNKSDEINSNIIYTKSNAYLSIESLKLAKNIVNSFK